MASRSAERHTPPRRGSRKSFVNHDGSAVIPRALDSRRATGGNLRQALRIAAKLLVALAEDESVIAGLH